MEIIQLLVLILVLIAVFWFMLFRPRQRARQQQQEMVRSLQIDDEVITIGGLIGRVTRLPEDDDGWIGFEISSGVEAKLLTVAIGHRIPAEEVEDEVVAQGFHD